MRCEVVTMKRKGRIFVTVLCVIVGIVIAATVAVRLVLTKDRLLTLVVPRIERRVGATIEIGDIGVRFPFGFGVDVKDLVFNKQLPDSSYLSAATERVVVKASLLSLIRKKPEIERVEIRGGDIFLTGTPRGIDVKLSGLEADLSVRPVEKRFLADVRASMDSVTLFRAAIDEKSSIREISLRGSAESDATFDNLRLEKTSFSWEDLITVKVTGEVADLRGERRLSLDVESRDTRVAPLVDAVLALRLEEMSYRMRGKEIGRNLPFTVTGGTIGFVSKIKGSARDPRTVDVDGTLDLSGIEVLHGKFEQPVHIDGPVRFTGTGARSEDITCTFGRSSAKVGFDAAMSAETREIESVGFDVNADLDVSELAAVGGVPGMAASGAVHASVKGRGSRETFAALSSAGKGVPPEVIEQAWKNLSLEGDVRLERVGISAADNPLVVSGLSGTAAISGGDVERIDISCMVNGRPFTVTGSLKRIMPALAEMAAKFDAENPPGDLGAFLASIKNDPHATLNVQGRSFDVRPFEAAAEANKGAAARKDEPPAGGKPEKANPFARNPLAPVFLKNTTFTARLDSIIAAKAVITGIDVRGRVENGKLTADPVMMHYAGGTGNAVVGIDFRDPRRIGTSLRLTFEGIEAGQALGGMRNVGNLIEGRFSFKTDGSFFVSPDIDPLMTLKASGSAESNSGRINIPLFIKPLTEAVGLDLSRLERFEFSDWIGNFMIENGRMFTDDWIIKSKSGDWTIRGSFGFDGTLDYVATVVIPTAVQRDMKDLSKYRDLVDLFRDETGNLVLDLNIGGEAKSPRIKLDRTRAKQKAGEKLFDELKKKAKGIFGK
jgi:hypothetical protein